MKTLMIATLTIISFFISATAEADVIISPTSNNGSFEDPAVGPSYNTWAYLPNNVYAYAGANPTGWSATTIQTRGEGDSYCANVTGNQFAIMDGGTSYEVYSISSLGFFKANTLYTLTADFGTNVAGGKAGTAYFKGGTDILSQNITTAASGNVMTAMPSLLLDTRVLTEFVDKAIIIGFTSPSNSDQLYLDNIGLTANAIPEPSTLSMIILGIFALLAYVRLKKK